MKFTDLFKRNRNAKTTPKAIQDYRSFTSYVVTKDETAFACIDKIASAFASLSYGVYSAKTHQKVNHSVYSVLKEPSLDCTHSLFFYSCIQDYFSGNVFLYKYTDENGNVVSLFRLNPDSVIIRRNEWNQKIYSYYGQEYTNEKIIHIPSRFGFDGLKGKSIFEECRKTFELSKNLETYTNDSFENSISGKRLVIDVSNSLPNAKDEEQQAVRNKYLNSYSNNNKPIIKTKGVEFSTLETGSSDNRSAQLSENRTFQQEIIAELFGVPVSYLNGTTTNLEETTTMFITNALRPLTEAFEQAFNQNLFKKEEKDLYYVEFNFNSIMKTSLQAKIDSYSKQIQTGQLTVNECRKRENLPELPGADYTFIPANLMPLTQENVDAYLAKSKLALKQAEEPKNEMEQAEIAETVPGLGSDKT